MTKELLKIDRKWQGGRNRKVIRVIWMSADLYRWTHWVVGFGCCVGKFCLFVISSTCSFSQSYCRVPHMWQFSSHDSSRWLTEEPRLYLFITIAKGFPGKLVMPVNRPELDQNRSDSELVLAHLQDQDLRYTFAGCPRGDSKLLYWSWSWNTGPISYMLMRSVRNFAHATAAELTWHVQICDLIALL